MAGVLCSALLGAWGLLSAPATVAEVESGVVRVVDAESGLDVPTAVRWSGGPGGAEASVRRVQRPDGRMALRGAPGRHGVIVGAPGYRSMEATLELGAAGGGSIYFRLAPDTPRAALRPEAIVARTRADAALCLGFVGDEDSGRPLAGVRIWVGPAGVETTTDADGFYELSVPWRPGAASVAEMRFEHPGHVTEVRREVVLWPGGDFTHRVRLSRGAGERAVDERETRRWRVGPDGVPPGAPLGLGTSPGGKGASADAAVPGPDPLGAIALAGLEAGGANGPPTVRVPRTIRVLHTNAVIYETLENYCRHVLPSEWYSSWGSYAGGSNSLQAGAVALRTYAIGYVHQPAGATYDICSTTSCQVYNPAVSTARADLAVAQTAGWVMVNTSLGIPRGLTEYSAENNQLGQACGDGFTAPTGGCLADPVCAGEAEFGHGRGMCQWGTVKWATGLKFPGNSFANTTQTNGQARQDWTWIARHYYPGLTLVQGTPLTTGDAVRAMTANLTVRACAGGSITNGANCPSVASLPSGTTGVVVGGPQQVWADGGGYTWWQVQWSTGVTGWSVENYLARVIPLPPAPSGVVATALSPSTARVSWRDESSLETGFRVERAASAAGPWTEATRVDTNIVTAVVSNLTAGTAWWFRVRAFNLAGDSVASEAVTVTSPPAGLWFEPVADAVVDEGQPWGFVARVGGNETAASVTDFESFAVPPSSGTVLFRAPSFSGSTSGFLEATPNTAVVTATFPSAGAGTALGTRVLWVNASFTAASNAWLRLTTFGATSLANPVIDFRRRLRFAMYADRAVRVGLGLRETTNAAGTTLGSDGGSSGAIEWVGISARTNSQPQPVRLVPGGAWTVLTFDVPNEPVTAYALGNGVLSTTSGLGVLEHLAIVPADGSGAYSLYFDAFEVVERRPLSFSLEPGSPVGAAIDAASGAFAWTPSEQQGPGAYSVGLRVTDDSVPAQTAALTVGVAVREVNRMPVLLPGAGGPTALHGGGSLVWTNGVQDPDWPANQLAFAAGSPWPAGATLDAVTGVLRWVTPEVAVEQVVSLPVRVTDNGSPPLSVTNVLQVRLLPRPTVTVTQAPGGAIELRWKGIEGRAYQVQSATEADAANWANVGSPIIALTPELHLSHPPVTGTLFFRVVALEP